MAEEIDEAANPTVNSAPVAHEHTVEAGGGSWSQLWQIPVLLAGVILLAAGVMVALPKSGPVDFVGKLNNIGNYVIARNFDQAQKLLTELKPFIDRTPQPQQARYSQLWGDVIYLQQMGRPVPLRNQYKKVIDYYQDAERRGLPADQEHQARWAKSLVALERDDLALRMMQHLPPGEGRYSILKRIIERTRGQAQLDTGQYEKLTKLVVRFLEEVRQEPQASKRRAQSIWAAALQAQIMLQTDRPAQAIDFLNLKLARLGGQSAPSLMVRLAQGYQQVGKHAQATTWYRSARDRSPPRDPLNAEILVGLAQIELAESSDVNAALGMFSRAARQFPTTGAWFDAIIGMADCQARLHRHPQAMRNFGLAVQQLLDQPHAPKAKVDRLSDLIWMHYEVSRDQRDDDQALEYLSLLQRQSGQSISPRLLGALANTHEDKGQERLEAGLGGAGGDDAPPLPEATRRVAFQEGAAHFETAADYYRRHARAVALSDEQAYGTSLWAAAENYDKAQRWKKSIDAFEEFIKNRAGEPRHLEAKTRLGLALMADEQIQAAKKHFQDLIENRPKSSAAHNSYVPLAQCHIKAGDLGAAERVLLQVVRNHPSLTPQASQYREALIELGSLYYRMEAYPRAIRELETAVQRYGRTKDGPVLHHRLAQAYRKSIGEIDRWLDEPLPPSRMIDLKRERQQRLERAGDLYAEAINGFEAQPSQTLSPLQRQMHRNAFFYRADCAYDLKDYEQAIKLYYLAARKFEKDPASLVALVQIVNAHSVLGQTQQARVAHGRAQRQLSQIPDEAFDDPAHPMTRRYWEDWLHWSMKLNLDANKT